MSSNEDYMDQLLQDAIDKENQMNNQENTNDSLSSMPNFDGDPNRSLTPEEIEAMFAMSLNLEMSNDQEDSVDTMDESSVDEIQDEVSFADEQSMDSVVDVADLEDNQSTDNVEFDSVLDDLLADDESVSFDSGLSDMADFSQSIQEGTVEELDSLIPEKNSEDMLSDISEEALDDMSSTETFSNSTEELEIDLDTVDDIDALLGLKEMPSDYKEGRKTAAHPEDVDIEGEDIDLLNALANVEDEVADLESDDLENQELTDILDMLGGDDSELAEINDILKKSENNELVDDNIDDPENSEESLDLSISADDGIEAEIEEESSDKKKSKRKDKKKEKKEKKNKKADKNDAEGEEKTKGFFGKIFEVLTAEVEEDEESQDGGAISEDGTPVEPAKKGKKNKKAKGKKGKGKGSVSNEDIMDELDAEDGKPKEKPKKKKKPKKEKKEKEVVIEEPTKKLPKKMVIAIFVLCTSIFAIIYIMNTFIPKTLDLSAAKKAYFNGDYVLAYEKMSGYKLNDNDQLIYDKVSILTKLDQKIKLYETYDKAGMNSDACNSLIEAVEYYQTMSDKIDLYGIRAEASVIYGQVIELLSSKYSLDLNSVYELINADSVTYTKKLRFICGESMDNPEIYSENTTSDSQTISLEDPLEQEFDN